jgi:hypothetical protein
VQFIAGPQGLQLSNRENLLKSKQAKAELVCNEIVSTVGIETEDYCLEQYISNNPVAHELLDFIKKENIGHITPSLVKSDVTSLKLFSQLSSKSIKIIAQDSRQVSKKPLVREIADIEIAVQAAKASPYILPVSQRLANFQDEEASFMTIIYSTFAFEQALLKPFFGKYIIGCLAIIFSIFCAYQFYQGQFIFAIVNLPRSFCLCSVLFCTHVLKSIQLGRLVMVIGFTAVAIACIAVIFIDKIENNTIIWGQSLYCSKFYEASKFSTCVLYLYVYYVWQGAVWLCIAILINWRQEQCWRWGWIGITIQNSISLVFFLIVGDVGVIAIGAVVIFPVLLIGTELLKFYGTLQAIRLTKESKAALSKVWRRIKNGEKKTPDDEKCGSLTELAKFVKKSCQDSPFVLDRSKDLGKWKAGHVAVEPPLIHQPTSDFDELYGSAVLFNDVFQQWIESVFTRKGDASRFLYINREKTKTDRFESSIPLTFRVVKRPSPELAVLKVDQLSDHVFFKNETILLHFPSGTPQPVGAPLEMHPLSIESVEVQGSTSAGIHSVIVVKCGEHANVLAANEPSFRGMTVPFPGNVDRGPVKRPHRSIAKVSSPAADVLDNDTNVLDNDPANPLQVYRSYRGDVTLLTDIVRCAVRFATPNDLLNFVQNWLFVYGEPKRPEEKTSMKNRFEKQFREFKDVVNDFFHPYIDAEDDESTPAPPNSAEQPPADAVAVSPPTSADARQAHAPGAHSHSEQGVKCDCNDCINFQRQHKIFEILRIRNRLDPALLDVPGGYRDFAIKIKIGFFRWS